VDSAFRWTDKPRLAIFAELLIDCEEDRTLRAVLVGMLREADRQASERWGGLHIAAPSSGRSRNSLADGIAIVTATTTLCTSGLERRASPAALRALIHL
jgi:hypothetical protein